VNVGMMRSRVVVEAQTETADPLGALTTSWSPVATLWALIRSPNGKEMFTAQQQKAVMTHVVECWWPGSLVTVTPQHRLRFNGAQYGIAAVINENMQNVKMIIHCTEAVTP
jgi:SPP1 family predicted phage head-tail adaptor